MSGPLLLCCSTPPTICWQYATRRSGTVQHGSSIYPLPFMIGHTPLFGPPDSEVKKAHGKDREDKNDQVDCCCWLCLSRRNFGARNNACADSSVGRHDHASSPRMRR